MKIERTKNATRNIFFGLIVKIYQLLGPFILRTIFIYTLGVEYLGLNSLFSSILSVLNLAELGVGSAMVFSMYKPIAEDDDEKICALMRLYRTYYRIIGFVILLMGLILVPFIPKLISGSVPSEINIYIIYIMNLMATVITYWMFAYKNCLLSAYQRIDICSKISLVISTIQYVLQAVLLVVVCNYYIYLLVTILTGVLGNITTAVAANKRYPRFKPKGKLEKAEIRIINHRVIDLFTSKLGAVVVDSADTVVISAFLGLQTLAIYNNYYFIMTSLFGFITIIYSACTAGIGNSLIVETEEKNYNDLKKFLLIIFWIAGICVSCLLCMFQPFMKIWVGEKFLLDMPMVICMCCYFYIHEINRLINTYKDAAGMWHEDKWRPLVTAICNLAMNLVLVHYIGLFGILLSTILSMLFVGMPWLLYNLFIVTFKRSATEFILILLKYTGLVIVSAGISYYLCELIRFTGILGLLVKGSIAFIVANVLYLVLLHRTREFEEVKGMLRGILVKNIGKERK